MHWKGSKGVLSQPSTNRDNLSGIDALCALWGLARTAAHGSGRRGCGDVAVRLWASLSSSAILCRRTKNV